MEIIKGENAIVRVALKQSNDSALLLSDCTLIKAEIMQFDKVVATYTYGTDDQIRQGATTSEVEIEITKSLSTRLKGSAVDLRLTIETDNEEFEVDESKQTDIMIEEIFSNVL